jgi:superfamily II DNA or RNA helicase
MIVASSRNPREFIQRRGRVLRKSATKQFAVIHDILVLPNSGVEDSTRQLVWGEIARASEFARSALNTDARIELEKACLDLGINLDDLYAALDVGTEDDEDKEEDQ